MRKILLITILLISLPIVSATYAKTTSKDTAAQASNQSSHINLHFLQTADSATLNISPDKKGEYILTLNNVTPYITYITQRPTRSKNVVPIWNFLKAWGVGPNSFKVDPPNIILIPAQIDGVINTNETTYIGVALSASYNASRSIMTYTAKPLQTEQPFLFKELKFDHVVLLIN
jgi:hypothetical protein